MSNRALVLIKELPLAWISGISALVGSSVIWWYFRSIGELPVGADPILTTWGCGHLLGLVLRNQAQAFTVFDGAE